MKDNVFEIKTTGTGGSKFPKIEISINKDGTVFVVGAKSICVSSTKDYAGVIFGAKISLPKGGIDIEIVPSEVNGPGPILNISDRPKLSASVVGNKIVFDSRLPESFDLDNLIKE